MQSRLFPDVTGEKTSEFTTSGSGLCSSPKQLPRRPIDDPEAPRQALIGDGRNDENLAVAQTHLAFIKFHNKVADAVPIGPDQLRESQKIVRQHYQSIVLHDFLPRLVRQDVLDDVLANGRRFLSPGGLPDEGRPFMPVEFSVAAYRLGHSMVRNSYEWNSVFNSGGPGPIASMALVFEFSEVSEHQGLFTEPTVPSDWIIRWNSFHDFTDIPGVDNHAQFNTVRKIDTRLALKLDNLPEFEKKEGEDEVERSLRSLAVRNLLRGMLVGLPSGQDVADAMGATKLTPDQVKTGDHEAILTAHGLHEETPLWYYILKEAEVFENGDRLGEVGSRILCETFHALLEGSADSILKETGWTPSLPSVNSDHFTMADLLLFVGDINPIG